MLQKIDLVPFGQIYAILELEEILNLKMNLNKTFKLKNFQE
jgi:hypothetical protein